MKLPGPPYEPGKSGNPGGRPKKTDEMRRAEALMRDRSESGAQALIDLSENSLDDAVRARLLCFRWEAVFGKAPQAITGAEGEPLIPRVDLSRLSDEHLAAIVAVGRAIASGPADSGGSGGDAEAPTAAVAPDSAT